jgi:tRNA(fMet)-specific endonuclease VapC
VTRLLDTDVCIDVLRTRDPAIRGRLRAMGSIAISSITLAELVYGAAHSRDPRRNRDEVRRFADATDVLEFDTSAAWHAGEIRHALAAAGTPIGGYDLLIAGHARTGERVLVTGNVGEFSRVDGLLVEPW